MNTQADDPAGGAEQGVVGALPPSRYPVLSVAISAITIPSAVETIDQWISHDARQYVSVCTSDTVLKCHDDQDLAAIVNGAGMATPDGMPLVWIGRHLGHSVSRVYGPDLMLAVCEHGLTRGYRHFFYGATPEVLADLKGCLATRFPGLQVVGTHAPPFRPTTPEEDDAIVAEINGAKPHIVWVGLGTPKQDFWVARFRARLDAAVLIPVGAAFAFHAGHTPQAPRWMMRMGLEWLFRLLVEPKRLWRRYIIGNPRFTWLILRQLLKRPRPRG